MKTQRTNLEFLSHLRQQMHEQNIMFSYRGHLSQDVMMSLLAMTEKKLEMEESNQSIRNKLFNVMVECMQNITRHCVPSTSGEMPLFMIGKGQEGYTIYSGNPIHMDKVRDLKNKLLKINTMSKEELKEFHKLWIQSDHSSDQADTILGLIDIARKTGNKLDFDFEPTRDDNYYFSLRTTISHSA
jgi:hypothetical protein